MSKMALFEVCRFKKCKQVGAEDLCKLKSDSNEVALLPSSNNYGWTSSMEKVGKLVNHGKVITMGKARYANIKYSDGYFLSSNNVIIEVNDESFLDTKYLYYFLKFNSKKCYSDGATYPKFDENLFKKLEIPIIGLDEQKKFVLLIDKLEEELSFHDELELKLDELLNTEFENRFNNKGYPVLGWNDVFNTKTGKLDSNAMTPDGIYPFFTCAKEVFKIDKWAFDQEALLLAGNNAAGKYDVKYYKGKFNAYQRTYVLDLKGEWSYQLFRHQLENKLLLLQEQSKGSNTKYITLTILSKLSFIVPPIGEQLSFENFANKIINLKALIRKRKLLYEELINKMMHETLE